MCLSIPVKILEIKDKKAIAETSDGKKEFDIQLLPDIKTGDYGLVSNGFIVKKITAEEAEGIFKILNPKKGGEK